MKKIVILIVGLCLSLSLWADDPNLDTATQIVTFPRVTVDNKAAYVNVQLLLDADGTWDILAFEPELEPELNLTGKWKGDLSELLFFVNFSTIECPAAKIEILFVQNGTELSGSGIFIGGCLANTLWLITGEVNGSNISFKISINYDEHEFIGTISSDYRTMMGIKTVSDNYSETTWSLSFQEEK